MLSDTDRAILDVERRTWKYAGTKEQAAARATGLTPTRYYQALNRLLDDPEAVAVDPITVNRLRRLRATRRVATR